MKLLLVLAITVPFTFPLEKPSPTPTKRGENKQAKPAQPDQGSGSKQCGTKESPCVVEMLPAKSGDVQAHSEAENEQHKSANYELLTGLSTFALAVITGILAFYTFRLWSATKHLSADAKESSDAAIAIARETATTAKISADAAIANAQAASKNAEFSEINAIATRQAAEAATKNTEFANKNVEMFISKERARLTFDLQPLDVTKPKWHSTQAVDFVISLHGATPAFITESSSAAYFVYAAVPEDPDAASAIFLPIRGLPKVMSPSAPNVESFAVWQWMPDTAVMSEVKSNRINIGIRGFVKYRDVFDRERITRFRYRWRYYDFSGVVQDTGEWQKSGEPEDNIET